MKNLTLENLARVCGGIYRGAKDAEQKEVDSITTDETKDILQNGGKLYTQIKIDEITNLGAVNIRLRSLFAAIAARKEGTNL